MESRFVYNLGALLKTTGVGSELYDFSGMKLDTKDGTDGAIGGGGILFNIGAGAGAAFFGGGCCCNFCCT